MVNSILTLSDIPASSMSAHSTLVHGHSAIGKSRFPAAVLRLSLALWALLGLGSGCAKKDPFVPPDLFYLFASYSVGKNPTSVGTADFNQDGFTDLITTNIGNNSMSVLFGNGDGTFREAISLFVCREPRA